MARISIAPVETLEMVMADGTIKEAIFNNESMMIFTSEFGNIDDLIKTELKVKPYDFIAKILYCGMKVFNKTVTIDEARAIVVGGGEPLMETVTNLMISNFLLTADESSKKNFHNEVERITKTLME